MPEVEAEGEDNNEWWWAAQEDAERRRIYNTQNRGTKRRGGAGEQLKRKQLMSTPAFQTALQAFYTGTPSREERQLLYRIFGGAAFREMEERVHGVAAA